MKLTQREGYIDLAHVGPVPNNNNNNNNNTMPPLEQTLSSSHHSVGSSSTRIFARVRHNLALSPSRNTKSLHSNTIHHSSASTTNVDSELRTAKDACIGAMMALLHYLSQHNIKSGSCVHEIHQTIPQTYAFQYDKILRRIIQQNLMKLSAQVRNDELDIIHMLVLGCWQAQHRLAQVQYQKAYRYYHSLRFNTEQQSQPPMKVGTSATLSFVTAISTPQLHQSHLNVSSSYATTTSTTNGETNIEKALHQQIQMAEYVCTCQKEMILCNRTYERRQCQQQYD